jgi:hypothetical protein
VQIFAAKHTFVRNARLRSIILVDESFYAESLRSSLPTISRNNRLVTAEDAPF